MRLQQTVAKETTNGVVGGSISSLGAGGPLGIGSEQGRGSVRVFGRGRSGRGVKSDGEGAAVGMVERREEGSGVTGTMDKAQKGPKIGHGSTRKARASRNLQQTVAKKTIIGVVDEGH